MLCDKIGGSIALVTTRQTRDPFGAFATDMIVGHKSVAAYDINSVYPLYSFHNASLTLDNIPCILEP